MVPPSPRPTGNPDPSLFTCNSSPDFVNSEPGVTLESIHFFVLSVLHPRQVTITAPLDCCLVYDLAPLPLFVASFFSPLVHQLCRTVIVNYFKVFSSILSCHLSHAGLGTNCSLCPYTFPQLSSLPG